MTHSYVWHDSFVCARWLIRMCYMSLVDDTSVATHSFVWHDSLVCVTWLIRMCDMTHSYVWHDSFVYVTYIYSFVCVTELIRMCDTHTTHTHTQNSTSHRRSARSSYRNPQKSTLLWFDPADWTENEISKSIWAADDILQGIDMMHVRSHVSRDPHTCAAWLILMCDMTHSHVRHDSFSCATWLILMCDMTILMCDMTHVRHDSCVTWPPHISCHTMSLIANHV